MGQIPPADRAAQACRPQSVLPSRLSAHAAWVREGSERLWLRWWSWFPPALAGGEGHSPGGQLHVDRFDFCDFSCCHRFSYKLPAIVASACWRFGDPIAIDLSLFRHLENHFPVRPRRRKEWPVTGLMAFHDRQFLVLPERPTTVPKGCVVRGYRLVCVLSTTEASLAAHRALVSCRDLFERIDLVHRSHAGQQVEVSVSRDSLTVPEDQSFTDWPESNSNGDS